MKTRNNLFSAVLLCVLVLTQSGCGGGSMGTGVRTLGNPEIERDKLPSLSRLFPGVSGCEIRSGSSKLWVAVSTELGGAKVITDADNQCSFAVPAQAERFSVSSPWLRGGMRVYYEWRDTPSAKPIVHKESLPIEDDEIRFPALRWGRRMSVELRLEKLDGSAIQILLKKAN